MRFDNWHHNGICLKTKKRWKFPFHSVLFSAAVCCYLRIGESIDTFDFFIFLFLFFSRFYSLTSLYARKIPFVWCSHIYVSFSCFPCCSFEIQSLSINYKHREEMKGDVIAIELRINCSDRKKERETHMHMTTRRQNGNCQWNSFFFIFY